MNRLYGSSYNPLYQSGTIVVLLFLVLLGTGLWLLIFYRIGAPWESVARLTASRWSGNWVRGLHRYASDAVVVATAVHAVRMLVQRRAWGPRALAWVSGVMLLGLVLVCGWTGFVMVWDRFGLALADEGARILEAVPLLSEPLRRTFTGERPVPDAFFFLNLFLHVALPLGLGLVLWLHVSRLARPTLLPPRRLALALMGGLVVVALVWPLTMFPRADPFILAERIELNLFYGFFLPASRRVSPAAVWSGVTAAILLLLAVPRLTEPRPRPEPSRVNPSLCTGCTQCSLDCPYEAITMVERGGGRSELVAQVNADRCVSCGICAGSCAPMGIGPPGRDGRTQLAQARAMLASERDIPDVMVIGCLQALDRFDGERTFPIDCIGNLHTSTVELCLRSGVSGVLILACSARDCRNREGWRWLDQRLFHGREAELQPRVDRRRIRVLPLGGGDEPATRAGLARFRRDLLELDQATIADDEPIGGECLTAAADGRVA
jgi:ferredoxin